MHVHLGVIDTVRMPSLLLNPTSSSPHSQFSTNVSVYTGIDSVGNGLALNQWYHLAYTLSDPQKRLDFYIDGVWLGFKSIQNVQGEYVLFNDSPLFIGKDTIYNGVTGQIR